MLAQWSQASPQIARRCIAWLQQRKLAAAVMLSCVALAVCAFFFQSQTSARTALFNAPLHPAQVAEVERALTLWNVPFSSNAQHGEVLVSNAARQDVLLRLTLAGLPHGYVPSSSDVLESSPGGLLSPTNIDDRRRAGIEGDLVAALRRIDGVADAIVVIAPASANPFDDAGARSEPSASVQLLMQPGSRLSTAQIIGLARFVAASYPALTPQRVAIVDGSGRLQPAQSNVADTAPSRELRLQNSIQSALDAVFGAGAAVVRVTMNNASGASSVQATRIYPHGFLESQNGRESGHEKGRTFERERSLRRYAYDTVVERRSTPAEATTHIAVAVFLNQANSGAAASEHTVADFVRAAAGADLARGDQVIVRTLPFSFSVGTVAAATRGMPLRWKHRLAQLAYLAAAALVLFGAAFTVKLQLRSVTTTRDAAAAAELGAALAHELPQTAAYVLRSMPHSVRRHVLQSYEPEYRMRIERHLNGARYG